MIAIVDNNWLQSDWKTSDIMSVWSIWLKFKSFWWNVFEIDWHCFDEICEAYSKAINVKNKPTCIVANTKKWKWVSFMEWEKSWHWKAPNEEQLNQAMKELIL